MDLLSIITGAASVGLLYVVYIAATKGVPAAYARLKSWWTAGKAGVAALEQDVADMTPRVAALEVNLGSLTQSFGAIQSEFNAVKAMLPKAAAPQSAAPSPVPSAGTSGQTAG